MNKKAGFVLLFILIFCIKALGQEMLKDPGFADKVNLAYDINVNGHMPFEYLIKVSAGKDKYEVISLSKNGTGEAQKERTLYSRNPFRPLYYTTSFDVPGFKYSKSIWWDWEKQLCTFYEVMKESDKKDQGEKFTAKLDGDKFFFNFALINTGLLCGLPINEGQKQCSLRIYLGQNSAKVNFTLIGRDNISTAGKDWDCYKIEANPELGPILNLIKFVLGNPKSYLWISSGAPRLIIKAHIKMPWMEYKANLKSIKSLEKL